MTLDEIEAEFLGVGDIDDAHATWWKEEYGALLIRAVRELGKGRRYKHGNLVGGTWVPYAPDVLALLEEAQ